MKRMIVGAAFAITAACLVLLWGCPPAPGGGQCVQEGAACATNADCCDELECVDGACVERCAQLGATCVNDGDCCDGLVCAGGACAEELTEPLTPALPAKTVGYELIAIHDPNSDGYNDDCIGCHMDRTNEVALDGVTPAAHATMLGLFGEGNDRCLRCHGSGPDFLTASAGGLREQVNNENAACAVCHGAQPAPGARSFYAE